MNARTTKPVSWIKAAKKDFLEFPDESQERILNALTIAADGGKADIYRQTDERIRKWFF